jgi:hypothetical protein
MNSTESADGGWQRFLCRNQFIFGPRPVRRFADWRHVKVTEGYQLSTHPDLAVTQTEVDGVALTLIGFMLDPLHPERTDSEILRGVGERLVQQQGIVDATAELGGRWILIIVTPERREMMTDAVGHRQIFYTLGAAGEPLWCASQPRMLAELTGRQMDSEAIDFINAYAFRKNPEYRWPGARSPYAGIAHLLPNHRLDLETGRCRRYWPDRVLPQLELGAAVHEAATLLKGSLDAAAHRFDLAVSLTAGLDSRVVCAAARQAVRSAPLMTVRQIDKASDHIDVTLAAQMARELGLTHHIASSSLVIDDDFLHAFKQNTALPHYIYAPDAQAISNLYQQRRVVATGSMSEIGRLSFRTALHKPETEPISAEDLARLQKMGNHPYAVEAFQQWLDAVGALHNLPLLDLFEWEQGHGNWLAMCHLEFDIAWRDLFTPFNCRSLLITLLGVHRRHRDKPDYHLYREIIHHLWPELLNFPINPGGPKPRANPWRQVKAKVPYRWKQRLKKVIRKS